MNKTILLGQAITISEYHKYSGEQWQGTHVTNIVELDNGLVVLPAGTVLRIDRKVNGFSLISEPCGCCGLKALFTKVKPYNLRRYVEPETL